MAGLSFFASSHLHCSDELTGRAARILPGLSVVIARQNVWKSVLCKRQLTLALNRFGFQVEINLNKQHKPGFKLVQQLKRIQKTDVKLLANIRNDEFSSCVAIQPFVSY